MEERVLILAQGRDGPLTCAVLGKAGFTCQAFDDVADFVRAAEAGAGTLILAEEMLTQSTVPELVRLLQRQPPWSDLPVIVVAASEHAGFGRILKAFEVLGNVSVLPRPLALETAVTVVRAALRARRRQYEARDLLRDREEAARRKDEFLAMLAHELRNPLSPVRSVTHLLRLKAKPEDGTGPALDILDRQVAHMARLIEGLLDVSRLTRGKVRLQKSVVRLADALRQAVDEVRPLLDEKGHRLELSLPEPPLLLEADATRLGQVLANVLHNAAKYTDPGGHLTVTAGRDGGDGVIRVCDNGPGITADVLPYVFELFSQSERSLDRSQGGLGIGLTVVKSLVELHGGSVRVLSDGPDCGTEVVIRLPALDAEPPRDGDTGRPGNAGAGGISPAKAGAGRVLVVEDNLDGARSLEALLRLWGFAVQVAHDGPQGLEVAKRYRPDVILLDIGLPGLNGYDVARRLRTLPEFAVTPILAVTGYGSEDDRRRAVEAGFDLHLTKPLDPAELREYLEDVLRRVAAGKARANPPAGDAGTIDGAVPTSAGSSALTRAGG